MCVRGGGGADPNSVGGVGVGRSDSARPFPMLIADLFEKQQPFVVLL